MAGLLSLKLFSTSNCFNWNCTCVRVLSGKQIFTPSHAALFQWFWIRDNSTSTAQCKTAVTPLLIHWCYSLALNVIPQFNTHSVYVPSRYLQLAPHNSCFGWVGGWVVVVVVVVVWGGGDCQSVIYVVVFLIKWHVLMSSMASHCLLRRFSGLTSKKISKLWVTDLCEGIPPVTGGFPSQRTSNSQNVSISLRHHASALFTAVLHVIPCNI